MSATTWLYGTDARLVEELRSLTPTLSNENEDARRDARELVRSLTRELAGREARDEEIQAVLHDARAVEELTRALLRERLQFLDWRMTSRSA